MDSPLLFGSVCPQWFSRCCLGHKTSLGDKQSPIDIRRKTVLQDPSLNDNPLQWSDVGLSCTQIVNNGHGWQVSVAAVGPNLRGGPLADNFQLQEFHGHWGESITSGSEHTVDGRHYAGELHFVHFNVNKYKNYAAAKSAEQGLQVMAVFLEEGSAHPELCKIVDCMSHVTYKGQTYSLQQQHLDVSLFVPSGSSYWTYEGSLTTAPWYENVTWIVYKQAIEVSSEQLQAFRQMTLHGYVLGRLDPHDDLIVKNTRPTQPLRGRVVREPLEEPTSDKTG